MRPLISREIALTYSLNAEAILNFFSRITEISKKSKNKIILFYFNWYDFEF